MDHLQPTLHGHSSNIQSSKMNKNKELSIELIILQIRFGYDLPNDHYNHKILKQTFKR